VDLGTRLLDACGDLRQRLVAAGIPATLDRSDLNAGGAFIAPQTLDLTTLGGDGTARIDVYLVTVDHGDAATHRALAPLLDRMVAALLVPAEPVDLGYALAVRDTTYAAYRVPLDLDL
jgi:hypothetical protein